MLESNIPSGPLRKSGCACTNHGECAAVCPKDIPLEVIGRMNQDLMHAVLHSAKRTA